MNLTKGARLLTKEPARLNQRILHPEAALHGLLCQLQLKVPNRLVLAYIREHLIVEVTSSLHPTLMLTETIS